MSAIVYGLSFAMVTLIAISFLLFGALIGSAFPLIFGGFGLIAGLVIGAVITFDEFHDRAEATPA